MLAPDPAQRPSIAQVHATLMTIRPEAERPVPAPGSTALRGKGLRAAGEPTAGSQPRQPSRLVGKLVRKLTDRAPR